MLVALIMKHPVHRPFNENSNLWWQVETLHLIYFIVFFNERCSFTSLQENFFTTIFSFCFDIRI